MSKENESKLEVIIKAARMRIDLMDALKELISDIEDEAFTSGQHNMLECGYQLSAN